MNTIFEKVLMVLEAEAGSFWVPDQQTRELVCKIAEGPAKKEVAGLRLKEGTGIVGWVMANKQNTVIFDASKDDRFSKKVDEKTKFVTKSMLCVPLVVKDECVGAIQVINKKRENGQFENIDLDTLENGSSTTAIQHHHGRLYCLQETGYPFVLNASKHNGKLSLDGTGHWETFDGALDAPFTAHPKIDPDTGDWYTYSTDIMSGRIHYSIVSKGKITKYTKLLDAKPALSFLHDYYCISNR